MSGSSLKKVSLLDDQRKFNKLCQKINKDYKCVEAFGCDTCQNVCPAQIFNEVQLLMNCKGLYMGEAYRLTQRASLEENKALEIIRGIAEGRLQYYPEKCPWCGRYFPKEESLCKNSENLEK